MRRSLLLWSGIALLVGSASIALLTSLSLAQPADNRSVTATYVHGVLRLSIADIAPRIGQGTITVEILDPEDGAVARVERRVYGMAGRGQWCQELALPA